MKLKLLTALSMAVILSYPISAAAAENTSSSCSVKGCQISGAHTHTCSVEGCQIEGVHTHGCLIEGCQIEGTHTHSCSVEGCQTAEAHTHYCSVSGCLNNTIHSHTSCSSSYRTSATTGCHSGSGHHSSHRRHH